MIAFDDLPKRERAVLELVYRLGEATAKEIHAALGDETSYSTVRTFLANLETKGRLKHRQEGVRFLWSPADDSSKNGALALEKAAETFFKGSRIKAVAALLGQEEKPLAEEEYRELLALIEKARHG